MTQTGTAASTPPRSTARAENPTGFKSRCRAVTDPMEEIGTRLRIALATDGNAEPFLIHARYEIESRMHVYQQSETEAAITNALRATGSTCQAFLNEATQAGHLLATPNTPLPIVSDEPALVIGGLAPGTVARWRERRDQANSRPLVRTPRSEQRVSGHRTVTGERVLAHVKGRWLADDMVDPDTYAKGVDDGWNDVELYRLIVRQLQRSFHSGTEADRRTMLSNRPRLTGTKWDAAMAAVIEHTARVHGYEPPSWVEEPERFLNTAVKLTRVKTDSDSVWQPGAFLRHGVSVDSRDLDWRTGDGRQWTAEL